MDTDGDEQAILAALQKHSNLTTVPLRLSIRVVQGVDVPATDEGGTSDPYVILSCAGMKKRTKVLVFVYVFCVMCVCIRVCVYFRALA